MHLCDGHAGLIEVKLRGSTGIEKEAATLKASRKIIIVF